MWAVAAVLSLPGAWLAWADGTNAENAAGRVAGSIMVSFLIALGLASLSKPRTNQRVLVFYCLATIEVFLVVQGP